MTTIDRRAQGYAAKFRAETIRQEPPAHVEPTDENLARIVSRPSIVRPARPEEYPAIRAALAAWRD
jgi:hypothetical protein